MVFIIIALFIILLTISTNADKFDDNLYYGEQLLKFNKNPSDLAFRYIDLTGNVISIPDPYIYTNKALYK